MSQSTLRPGGTDATPRRPGFYLAIAAGLYLFIEAYALLAPIVLSLLLIVLVSLAVNPLIMKIRSLIGGRRTATGLLLIGFLLVAGFTLRAVYGPLRASSALIAEKLPGYWERFQRPLIRLERQSALSEAKLQTEIAAEPTPPSSSADPNRQGPPAPPAPAPSPTPAPVVRAAPHHPTATPDAAPGILRTSLGGLARDLAGGFRFMALSAAQVVVVLVSVFFGVLFTLMNPRPILAAIFAMVPGRHHPQALTILRRISAFLPRWAKASLLAMLAVGVLVFAAMWPLLGFADALVLGIIAGLLEAVPYLGPALSAIPALLIALGAGGATPLWVLLAYVAVQLLENNVITPLIVAGSMKLHPLAVLFSMLLCVAAFGALGLLIAAPMVAVTEILHDELYRKRFLPAVTDAQLEQLAREALGEGALRA